MEAKAVLGRGKSKVSGSHLGSTSVQALMFPESSSHLQGHLPGPGTRNSILSIDDPGQTGQLGMDGRDPTAWGDSSSNDVDRTPQPTQDPTKTMPPPLETSGSPKPLGLQFHHTDPSDPSYIPRNEERESCLHPGMSQEKGQKTSWTIRLSGLTSRHFSCACLFQYLYIM